MNRSFICAWIEQHFILGVRGQSCHHLTPFVLEERGLKRHFRQTSLVVVHAVATASAQNDNGSLEAKSIVSEKPQQVYGFPRLFDNEFCLACSRSGSLDVQCLLL
ncbi:hypothetical protein Tco_0189741 [Tanacetum coccineum]